MPKTRFLTPILLIVGMFLVGCSSQSSIDTEPYNRSDYSGGYGGPTSMATPTPTPTPTPTVQPATAPNAPTNLTLTVVSSSQIDVRWNDNSDNEEGFLVYRSLSSFGPFTQVAQEDVNAVYYSDLYLDKRFG